MKLENNLINNFNNVIDTLCSVLPLAMPFTLMSIGGRLMKKQIYEEKLRDINKKDLFSYLISSRVFVDSLTDDEIKGYYKIFKNYYKDRKRENIKQCFCYLFFRKFG